MKYYQSLQIIIFASIFSIVIAEGAHQYHRHQTSKENYHHERIEDREPVDLQKQLFDDLMSQRNKPRKKMLKHYLKVNLQ